MKAQIQKSVALYLLYSIFFILTSNAQIIFNDITDTTLLNTSYGTVSYALDINNDSQTDFNFINTRNDLGYCCATCAHKIKCLVSITSINPTFYFACDNGNPSVLNYGDLIDTSMTFMNGSDTLSYLHWNCPGNSTNGNWNSPFDKYLPFRFSIGSNNYYGWIKMSIDIITIVNIKVIIKDFGYSTVANQFIQAGDTGNVVTGIIHQNFAEQSFEIYPNPVSNSITIKFPADEPGEIQIVNLFGQIVFSEKIFADEIKIDVSKFSTGMYVVRWNNGENFESKGFSILK